MGLGFGLGLGLGIGLGLVRVGIGGVEPARGDDGAQARAARLAPYRLQALPNPGPNRRVRVSAKRTEMSTPWHTARAQGGCARGRGGAVRGA